MHLPRINALDLRPGFTSAQIEIATRSLPRRVLDAVKQFILKLNNGD